MASNHNAQRVALCDLIRVLPRIGDEQMSTDRQSPATETQTTQAGEQRGWPRRTLLRSTKILYSNRSCVMDCVIVNMSEGGAKLRPADMAGCPNEFALQVHNNHFLECEVVWRKQNVMGVRFVSWWRAVNDVTGLVPRKNRS